MNNPPKIDNMVKFPFEDAESVAGFIERGPTFPRESRLFSDSAYEELDRLVKLLFLDTLLRRSSIVLVCDDSFMPSDKTQYDRIATRMFPELRGTHFEAFMLLYWQKTYNMDDIHVRKPEPCRDLIKYLNAPSTHLEQSLNSVQRVPSQFNEEYTFPFNERHMNTFLNNGPTFPRGGSDILSDSDYEILDVEFKHFWLTLLAKHYVTNSNTKYALDKSFMPCSSSFNMKLAGVISEVFLLTSIYHPLVENIYYSMYNKSEAKVVIEKEIELSIKFRTLAGYSSLNKKVCLKGQQDRESRRMAIAMALHPREGEPMHWPLNEDNTKRIADYAFGGAKNSV